MESVAPTYSICMCNYNMEDTIERSLVSILDQIDPRFEVVLLDDGSSDSSVDRARALEKDYPYLRVVSLERDRSRRLGMTRNLSIEEAAGKYVILHLDCDDACGPYLRDFCDVFHRIEKCRENFFMLCGQHIYMAERSFLLEMGPYRNIYRGEDRDLLVRLAKEKAYIPLVHVDFIERLERPKARRYRKVIWDTWDALKNEFCSAMSIREILYYDWKRKEMHSAVYLLMRWFLILPAWIRTSGMEKQRPALEPEEFAALREEARGTYREVMERMGGDPDLEFLGDQAREVFG
ncbi:MAG: glycosyltransferase family A protein [Verrucomicrobiota bacterium]